ncbi:MAG TPA: Mpo1-like protein [Candidatus Eisenbacteria bacterium]|nr:Mpo1-like protein [Candidatus Eisenbacteria bacterium]
MKPRLVELLSTYADYHRHPLNRLVHFIGIPLIVFNAVSLLDWVLLGHVAGHEVTLAHLAFVAVIGWYATLDRRLAALMALWYGLCFPLGWYAPWPVIIGAGVVGWTIQFIGHAVWEKRSPALFKNLLQALVGPLYLAALAARLWPPKDPRP